MLNDKQIRKIKIKMLDSNITQKELAENLGCSSTAIHYVLNKKKEMYVVEFKILNWLKGR